MQENSSKPGRGLVNSDPLTGMIRPETGASRPRGRIDKVAAPVMLALTDETALPSSLIVEVIPADCDVSSDTDKARLSPAIASQAGKTVANVCIDAGACLLARIPAYPSPIRVRLGLISIAFGL